MSMYAQQPISTNWAGDGVEVMDTMTVGGGEIIGTVTVDNVDYEDIDYVGAEACLSLGCTVGATSGTDDFEYDTAASTATSPITTGQAYTLYGYAGACYYYYYGDDDDDDDDDGGLVVRSASVKPAMTEPPGDQDCEGGWLGYVPLTLQTGVPSITSISPNTGNIGDSNKTISVTGENLQDELDVSKVSISGSGVSASVSSPGATDATVTYSISTGASTSTGARQFTMSNSFGTSNAETFTIVDPSPNVTGVSPSTWYAGSSYTVTITGTNFGTNPSVSIALPSGTIQPTTSNPSDTSVTVSFSVPANSPSGTAPVTVTSTGFNGSGFYPGNSGNSPSASNNSGQTVAVTPAPQIMIIPSVSQATDTTNLSSCTGGSAAQNGSNETNVFAGQKMLLCVLAPPNGLTIASSQWSFDNNVDISGGFVDGNGDLGTQPSDTAGGSEAGDPNLTQSGIQFYFVNPGTTETATYHWTLSNGDPNGNGATADFNIQGPTGSLLPNAFAQSDITGTSLSNSTSTSDNPALSAKVAMSNSPLKPAVGIVLNDNATLPSGKFIWVQILNSVTYSQLVQLGQTYTPSNASNQIDGIYPYFNGTQNTTWDSPARSLHTYFGEGAEAFSATMYVLWDAALPAGCTPAWTDTSSPPYVPHASTCTSTPIPLGSVQWSWSPCAINALALAAGGGTTPSWFTQCGIGSGNSTGVASGYPQWTSGTGPGGCYVSANADCQ
jgi:hypothetical protein